MSWGGWPLSAPLNRPFRTHFPKLAEAHFKAIHRYEVWYNDLESRNMIFDKASMRLMVIDWERSAAISKPTPASITSSGFTKRTAKKRARYQSVENELAVMRNCMRN